MSVPDSNASVTAVAASTSVVTLFPARYGDVRTRTVYNASTAVLYLKFGADASTSLYTLQIPALGGFYEFPGSVFDGLVTGVWASANGSAMCTEVG